MTTTRTKHKLTYLAETGRWDEAYISLLNAENPYGCRCLRFGKPLLAALCEKGAPPKLIDLAASLFPHDIVPYHALHKVICRNDEHTADNVKNLLEQLADHLGSRQKIYNRALMLRGPLYRVSQIPFRGQGQGPAPRNTRTLAPTRNGGEHTPLELACLRGATLETLQALVQANPQALLEASREHTYWSINSDGRWISKNGTTPLATLWHRERIVLFKLLNRPRFEALEEGQLRKAKESSSWEKLQYLILETYFATKPRTNKTTAVQCKEDFLLHALVQSSDVDDGLLFLFAVQLCEKEHAFVRDEEQDIPLHKLLGSDNPPETFSEAIKALLKLAPESAQVQTKFERFPLHVAIGKLEWHDGLDQLVDFYSPAVSALIVDKRHHGKKKGLLYAFQYAAVRNASLESVYHLLLTRPDLLLNRGEPRPGREKKKRSHTAPHDPSFPQGRLWRQPRGSNKRHSPPE